MPEITFMWEFQAKIFVHVPKAWVVGKAYHNYSNKAAVTMQ